MCREAINAAVVPQAYQQCSSTADIESEARTRNACVGIKLER